MTIANLIRALARPYPGAHFLVGGQEVKIWKATVVKVDESQIRNLEPGKVLSSGHSCIRVRCGDGAIDLVEHEFDPLPLVGGYL